MEHIADEREPVQQSFFEDVTSFEKLFSICPDAIIGIDRGGIVRLLNPAAERLTGRKALEAVARLHIAEIYPSTKTARQIKKLIHADAHGGPGFLVDYETRLRDKQGREIPILLSVALLCRDGEEVGSFGFFHDMTVRKDMERRLRELSITDSLTGLYNQRHFYASLSRELSRAERYKRSLSLICFDLDRFKECNDAMGHQEGDNVLRLVGTVLRSQTRQSDQSFRYGGDEFFVLLPETPLSDATAAAEKIRTAFNRGWPYDSGAAHRPLDPVTLSIGVAEAAAGDLPEGLVKRGDLAMYEAKKAGGDRIRVADAPAARP
jgi:diguanylate cyclase (GGDEF)-like protein/PAS domain S-box-containing protein